MQYVNILTRYKQPLFTQHVDSSRFGDRMQFLENSVEDRKWDLVIVFDGLPAPHELRVRPGGLVFVAGEPPDAIAYTGTFLGQFDKSYCAHPKARRRPANEPDQYFNNWHFGYDASNGEFRWTFEELRDLPPPSKTKDISVIMSNLAYMPNHLKRRHFLARLQELFGDQIDVYGRGQRFIPYKDEALLPYRFHICIENCVVPDLWTEKLADPFLGWSVPVYAGCPNVDRFWPENAIVRLDMDDVEGSLATIGRLLKDAPAEYQRRLGALKVARERVLVEYNITTLAEKVLATLPSTEARMRRVVPNESTRGHVLENQWLRARRLVYRRCYQLAHRASRR